MGKQRLGFSKRVENKKIMIGESDFLYQPIKGLSLINNLIEYVKESEQYDLVVHSLDDLDLQLIQLHPILEAVREQGKILRFIDQGLNERLPDDQYFELLFELASAEKRTMQRRYEKSKIEALANGKTFGRPVIQNETIERIQYLYTKEKNSIREISRKCNVSVGTVHKYVKQGR